MFKKFDKAKRIAGLAEHKLNKAKSNYTEIEKNTKNNAMQLTKLKNKVYTNSIENRFIPFYQQFRRVRNKKLRADNYNLLINDPEVNEFGNQATEYKAAIQGLISATTAGASAGLGAVGLAGSIGVASTGTAISSLSGAAASNATLAWFGGGSLASGGFGMAGGMAVLGGITIIPALAIGGFIINSKGEKLLTEANRYKNEVSIAIEKIENAKLFLRALNARILEVTNIINLLDERLNNLLDIGELLDGELGKKNKYDKNSLTEEDEKLIFTIYEIAKMLKLILEEPLVKKEGGINNQLNNTIQLSKNILNGEVRNE